MQEFSDDDTIAAIATPVGEGGVAIIRISGRQSFAIADQIFSCAGDKPSRRSGGTFVYGKIVSGSETLDRGLCLFMRTPHSFTGEDTVELHCHGGMALSRRVLRAALDAGARAAQAGEFSKRAFLNGKVDLLQAEAVLDVIRAQTDESAKVAVEQLEGGLSRSVGRIFDELLALCADVEATLDFSEEELPELVVGDLKERLSRILGDTSGLIETWNQGRILREGLRVVIAGRPNAGKSTLLNALLGMDRAIVSHHAGTTRDVIEESVVVGGVVLRVSDTAGLRETMCDIEAEGIRRSIKTLGTSDLCIYVVDASGGLSGDDISFLLRAQADGRELVVVLNKLDLHPEESVVSRLPVGIPFVCTCLLKGEGVKDLKACLSEALSKLLKSTGGLNRGGSISERHRALLIAAEIELRLAASLLDDRALVADSVAFHLKQAGEHIGRILGRSVDAELLNEVFSRFCVGK